MSDMADVLVGVLRDAGLLEDAQTERDYAEAILAAGFASAREAGAVALEEAADAPLPAPKNGQTSGFRYWLRARAVTVRGGE